MGAGWAEGDVADALKEGGEAGPAVQPAAAAAASPAAMSPLESFSKPAASTKTDMGMPKDVAPATVHSEHHVSVPLIAISAAAFVFASLAGYLFWQGGSSSADLAGLNSQISSLTSSSAKLQAQVADLTKSNADLAGQAKTLTDSNTQLAGELSFYLGAGTSTVTSTIKGVLSGGAGKAFSLMTADGIKVSLKNSLDAKIAAALQAAATSSEVSVTGTHLPKSFELTVSAVNGAAVQ